MNDLGGMDRLVACGRSPIPYSSQTPQRLAQEPAGRLTCLPNRH